MPANNQESIITIAKSEQGAQLINKAYGKLHNVEGEFKTNHFDDNLALVMMNLISYEKQYYEHIRLLKVPTHIIKYCTIKSDAKLYECIYIMPKFVNNIIESTSESISNMYNPIKEISYDNMLKILSNIHDAQNISEQGNVAPFMPAMGPTIVEDTDIFDQYVLDE